MKKKKTIILVTLIIVAFFVLKSIGKYRNFKTYKKQVTDITISNLDLYKVADGIYTGSYEVLWVSAKVKVTVKKHNIIGIELLNHKNGRGAPAEIIPNRVVEAQSLKVDIVAGATSSSKVILKAIENALNNEPK